MPTRVRTRAELGASNNSKGKRWMHDIAIWLRAYFPGAEVISNVGHADLAGLTDWTVEAKNDMDWFKVAQFLTTAGDISQVRGTRWHVVLKKRRGAGDPGCGFAVMTMNQWREIAWILDDHTVQARIRELT